MKIAIVGCGVGGLAAALFLHRQGHALQIFEAFAEARPVGSGLMIQPTGQAVLQRLGLLERAIQVSAKIAGLDGRDIAGPQPLNLLYADWQPGAFGLGIHRAELFGLLFDALTAEGLRPLTDHRMTSSHLDGDGRWLSFATPNSAEAVYGPYDLVVDASGAHSPLRGDLITRDRPFAFGAVWSTIHSHALSSDRLHQRFDGARYMMGALPLGTHLPHLLNTTRSTPTFALFWSLPRSGLQAWQQGYDAWLASLADYWPDLVPAIAELPGPQAFSTAWYNDTCLKRFVRPRLALIGDAAHTTSPQLGQGGNLALLDAACLSQALCDAGSLERALAGYDAQRRPHTRLYQNLSRWITPMFQSHRRSWGWLRNTGMPLAGRVPVLARLQTQVMAGVQTGYMPWQHARSDALAGARLPLGRNLRAPAHPERH